MRGELVRFGAGRVAFCSGPGPPGPERALVFVGGLTDGLLATWYVEALGEELARLDPPWGLVQPLLSSGYSGFGTSSLARDADELAELTRFLRAGRGVRVIALAGHSTGCQDAVAYVRSCRSHAHDGWPRLAGVVLQAPVSDREWNDTLPGTPQHLAAARALVAADRGDECLPPAAVFGVPVSAERYLSLYAEGGDDDMFSSDLNAAALESRLGHMVDTPALLLFSEADEYVPDGVDTSALASRVAGAMGPLARSVVVPRGDHALSEQEFSEWAIARIGRFVSELAVPGTGTRA